MNCESHPRVSVIICTLGTSPQLRASIESVLSQDCSNMELIVVHSGQAVDSVEEVLSNLPVKILRDPARGVCRARNRALQHSDGEILAFVDDDVVAQPEWLHRLLKGFNSKQIAGATGLVIPIGQPYLAPSRYVSELALSDWELSSKAADAPARAMSTDTGFGCNMAFRRSFLAEQPFPEQLGAGSLIGSGDESYMFLQLLRRGYSLYHCGTAAVSHRFDLDTDVPQRVQGLVAGAIAVHLTLMVAFKDVRKQILRELFHRGKRAFDTPNDQELPRHWRQLSIAKKLQILIHGVVLYIRSLMA